MTDDRRDLYWRFRQASGMPYNGNTWYAYMKFLGLDGKIKYVATDHTNGVSKPEYGIDNLGNRVDFTEETMRKIEWLSGPHYKTFCNAAWRARNGEGN